MGTRPRISSRQSVLRNNSARRGGRRGKILLLAEQKRVQSHRADNRLPNRKAHENTPRYERESRRRGRKRHQKRQTFNRTREFDLSETETRGRNFKDDGLERIVRNGILLRGVEPERGQTARRSERNSRLRRRYNGGIRFSVRDLPRFALLRNG